MAGHCAVNRICVEKSKTAPLGGRLPLVRRGCASSAVTVSFSSLDLLNARKADMQPIFVEDEQKVKMFISTISKPRLTRYLKEANGNNGHALLLYHWNSLLSQCLYLHLQMWEISLRNKMNSFLCWKYGPRWFEDARALRAFGKADNEKLSKTILRQLQNRKSSLTVDQIVADLSAGFWVSLLSARYDVPFTWRYNLTGRVFTHGQPIERQEASDTCGRLLDLRNRVAHHEPIFHLDLVALRTDLERILESLCSATQEYLKSTCSFEDVWASRPKMVGSQEGET